MADPVKISELPTLSSVQPNDILPIVDAALTQTSKCTASQIAAIGGGPPGDGMVTTAKLAAGAATAEKIGFTGPNKMVTRTAAGAGGGVEVDCTPFGRSLIAAANGNDARTLINDSSTFSSLSVTGQANVGSVSAQPGSVSAPAYTFAGDPNTGISQLAGADTLSIVTNGVERARYTTAGRLTPLMGTTDFRPAYDCRAFARLNIGTSTIGSSHGFSSVAFTSYAGSVAVLNFATPMPDNNYAAVCGSIRHPALVGDSVISTTQIMLGARVPEVTGFYPYDGSFWPSSHISIAVFR
jgi:hypothetical protein